MQTQWYVGMQGRTGLRYTVLFRFLDDLDLPRDEWQQVFDDVQLMEFEALQV